MNRSEQWTSRSEAETIAFGEEFCRTYLQDGTLVTIRGELGAGKTHFIKGIARALGIDERELTSPTFALVHEFEVSASPKRHGLAWLFHLDCYRFEQPGELLQLGIEDYLYPHHAATIIEWPERIESLLPRNAIDVVIALRSERERTITVHPPNTFAS